ncbi:hypothetical protein J2D73_16175 [Acetobacter sacchari]|uniref:Uncharacterized protein n=1 Tax=Acetobacter sacchari TaxID=2661687 RepID=A0ABS3LZJ5_9PROT|nr:DUF6587 family protein [Acetobacter sacchari]MBO1361325.1 hypothetical protein [Acetobacter sacchari]
MIETAIVVVVVACCSFYWLGRLAPSAVRPVWQGLSRALASVGAPAPMQRAVAGRLGTRSGGCGTCKGCGKGGGCH